MIGFYSNDRFGLKSADKWSPTQKERAAILFDNYPDINPNRTLEKSTIFFLLENTVFSSNKEVAIVYNAKKQGRVLTY